MLKIGNIELDNPFFAAPLAGVTDAPYRRLCRRFGAALVYSEMVSAKGLYYNDKKTEQLLYVYEDEKPTAYQIFGSDPEIMAYAARELEERDNIILDVNMGCPVPKVVKNGEGSALMKNPDLVYRIISAMTKATDKPVTAKIRAGFDSSSLNAVEVAKAIEAGGAAAVEPEQLESIAWTAEQVRTLAQCMRRDTPLHLLTRGTHSCFLARNGELLFAGEDIGRHNALDKAIGWALMNGVDLRTCMAHISGRVPKDMVMKAVRAHVPVLVSKEAPTAEGLAAARRYQTQSRYDHLQEIYRAAGILGDAR